MTNLEHPSRKLTLEKNWINVIHALSRLGIVDPLALSAEIDFRFGSVTLDP